MEKENKKSFESDLVIGIYYFKNHILKRIPNKKISLENEIINNLIKTKNIKGKKILSDFIDIGTYSNRFTADKILIKTALSEIISLEGSLRKVVKNKYGFRATFLGLSENKAGQACKRLRNRNISCDIISPD